MNNALTKPKTILLLSDNRDFIESFSALVTRELGVICQAVALESEIPDSDVTVLVTDRTLNVNCQFSVIKVDLPVRIQGVLSDIQSVLENSAGNDTMEIGADLQLSLQNKVISNSSGGITADLTDKESHLLQMIAQSGDSGIAREVLLKEVWGFDSALDTHTLETHIYRLRKKIRDSFDIEVIKAFEGGYRLL